MQSSQEVLNLPKAVEIISSLENQLTEVETVSKEYEFDLEQVISKLKNELISNREDYSKDKNIITNLEIQVDELESENIKLKNKLDTVQEDNDRRLEQNVLLEHELMDLKNTLAKIHGNGNGNESPPPQPKKRVKLPNPQVKIAISGSTLLLKNEKNYFSIPDTHISPSTVITTTNITSISK